MDEITILKKDLTTAGSNERFNELIIKTHAAGNAIIKMTYGHADIMGTITVLTEASIALQQICMLFPDEIIPEPDSNERPDIALTLCAIEIIKYLRGSSTMRLALQQIINAARAIETTAEAFPAHLWKGALIKHINDIERRLSQEDGYEFTNAPVAKIS